MTYKGQPFIFDQACLNTFNEIRERIITVPILAYYDVARELRLETNTSEGVVRGVRSQQQDVGFYYPVIYFSKTIEAAELNYEIHDKEILAIVRCL